MRYYTHRMWGGAYIIDSNRRLVEVFVEPPEWEFMKQMLWHEGMQLSEDDMDYFLPWQPGDDTKGQRGIQG